VSRNSCYLSSGLAANSGTFFGFHYAAEFILLILSEPYPSFSMLISLGFIPSLMLSYPLLLEIYF